MNRSTRRYFLFDDEMKLAGWTDTLTGEIRWATKPIPDARQLAFSGIHMISPEIFNLIEEQGRFSVIDTYLKLAENHPINGFLQPGMTWFDLGKPDQIASVSKYLADHPEFQENL
jgi:NDP-sugar pyrophosphorylase family protein